MVTFGLEPDASQLSGLSIINQSLLLTMHEWWRPGACWQDFTLKEHCNALLTNTRFYYTAVVDDYLIM